MVYGEEEDRRVELTHLQAEIHRANESVHQLEHERDAYRSALADLLAVLRVVPAFHAELSEAKTKARNILKNGPPPLPIGEPK